MGRSCPEGEQIETLVDHMVHDPAQAPVDAHLLEGRDTACVAQCLIDLADTSDTPEIRMSLESVVDEGNTNVVSSRKPEANPRVGSANASVRTMQDRHAALVAMISTKMADKQMKRDDLTSLVKSSFHHYDLQGHAVADPGLCSRFFCPLMIRALFASTFKARNGHACSPP
jgi:hypothetical protein